MKKDRKRGSNRRKASGEQPSLPLSPSTRIVDKNGLDLPDQVKRYITVLIRERMRILTRLLNPELTLYEAAILLRVSRNTLRRLTNDGVLQCIRTFGKQRRFKLNDLLVYLAQNDPALQQSLQTIRTLSELIAQTLKDLNEEKPPDP